MKNKINFILIIIILVSINLHGQNDTINQINDQGLKFGYWKEYHENGKIRAEGNYKIEERELSEEEKFFYDLEEYDSVANQSIKVGEWKNYDIFGKLKSKERFRNGYWNFTETYYYDSNGELVRIERNDFEKFFGVEKNIEIEKTYFFITGTIGNTEVKYININSLCDQKTDFFIKHSSDRIKLRGGAKTIEPNSQMRIPFTFSIQPDSFSDYIKIDFINSDTTRINIEIESFGYHLSSRDFQLNFYETNTYRFKEKILLYYREFGECEMKIYKYEEELSFRRIEEENIEPLIIFPLSHERNEIDLKKLRKGKYLLTTIDYRSEIEMMIKLIIE